MNRVGPIIETLTRRLAETPADFLQEPRIIGYPGKVCVAALVNDALHMLGNVAPVENLERFEEPHAKMHRPWLALIMVVLWLLTDEWFLKQNLPPYSITKLLDETIFDLAQGAPPAHKFVTDSDRREELARVVLASLDYRPEGETLTQATDRLLSVSGVERNRLEQASRASQERARAIREALEKKLAEESADKWTRE